MRTDHERLQCEHESVQHKIGEQYTDFTVKLAAMKQTTHEMESQLVERAKEREAVDLYARLAEGRAFAEPGGTRSRASAADCLGCSAPCEAACPEGLPIRKLMGQAHRTLS